MLVLRPIRKCTESEVHFLIMSTSTHVKPGNEATYGYPGGTYEQGLFETETVQQSCSHLGYMRRPKLHTAFQVPRPAHSGSGYRGACAPEPLIDQNTGGSASGSLVSHQRL